ncbi:DUF1800 domain-containing protein [Rhodobacteraceae bacterium CCMM004]|nr:DUF1800 domain-containing protein [Rhodobacteraceae bacterium CCMM004]
MSRARPAALASVRFGTGLVPGDAPRDGAALLASLAAPDAIRAAHPGLDLATARDMALSVGAARRAGREDAAAGQTMADAAQEAIYRAGVQTYRTALARYVGGPAPLRERLTWFWADHFTAVPKNPARALLLDDYLDAAIRTHLTGRFADLLTAAVTHPLMLLYLDQAVSVGPGSRVGQSRGRGLNENLAREVLELHTLGAGGGYGQADVRQLAELLTGLTYSDRRGARFRPGAAEPGAETVLGRSYGGDGRAALSDIHAVLADLSVHPATARHLAGKLAAHFVADPPDPDLAAAVAATWARTDGDLMAVYAALVQHPAAAAPELRKVKPPFDFQASALRALGVDAAAVAALDDRTLNRHFRRTQRRMGQDFMRAHGPDGWDEAPEAWINPQGLASRIQWAMAVPSRLRPDLPDPRRFVVDALGPLAGARLSWAASAAETRKEGVALVLAAPEFNRR